MRLEEDKGCTFVAETDPLTGNQKICGKPVFCKICGYCVRHCLQHLHIREHLLDANQAKMPKETKREE